MAFTIYARGPIEQGSQTPYDQFETYGFVDIARYENPAERRAYSR